MISKLWIVALLGFLGACASPPKVYNPENSPEDKLASVSTEDIGAWLNGGELFSEFVKVWDDEGNEIATSTFMKLLPDKLILKSGKYQLLVKCATTNGMSYGVYSYGRVYPSLESGSEHVVYCLSRSEKNTFGISMIKELVVFISLLENYEEERAANVALLAIKQPD